MKKRTLICTSIIIAVVLALAAITLFIFYQSDNNTIKFDVYDISTKKAIYSPATHTGYVELSIDNNHGGFEKLFLTQEDENKDGGNLIDNEQYQLKLYSGGVELPGMVYQIQYKSHEQTLAVDFTSTSKNIKSIQLKVKDVEQDKDVLEFGLTPEIDETNIYLTNSQTAGTISISATGLRTDGLDPEQKISDAKILYADGSTVEFLSTWKEDLPIHSTEEDMSGTGEYVIALDHPEDIVRISTKKRDYYVSDVEEQTSLHELPAADNLRYIEDINTNFYQYSFGMSADDLITYLKKNGAEYVENPSGNGDRLFRLTNSGRFMLRCSETAGLYEVHAESPVGDDTVSRNVTKEEAIENLKAVYGQPEREWGTTKLENLEFQYGDSYLTYSFMGEEIFSVVRSKYHYEPR